VASYHTLGIVFVGFKIKFRYTTHYKLRFVKGETSGLAY